MRVGDAAAATTAAAAAKTLKPRAACCSAFQGKPHGGAPGAAGAERRGRFPQTWKEGAATELKPRSEHRLKSFFFFLFFFFFAHFNIHPHTHKTRAQPDSSAKPLPPLPVKSIAIFCITTCRGCGGLVYCIRRGGKSIKKRRETREEKKS